MTEPLGTISCIFKVDSARVQLPENGEIAEYSPDHSIDQLIRLITR